MEGLRIIKKTLEKAGIDYEILEHEPAYTALEIAQAQHIPGRRVIKTVIINADGSNIMCVLPSTHKIDFEKLKRVLRARDVKLVDEDIFSGLFPDFELGAMPPFTNGLAMKIYADKVLEENDTIVFNAGSHVEMIRIKMKDFIKLAQPTFADIGAHI